MFSDASSSVVYCDECWWSDAFDPLQHGRPFDFGRPFFAQFAELLHSVPLPRMVIGNSQNSDYTNYAWQNKDSYLLSSSDYNEDCFYSTYLFRSRSCFDCLFVSDSELLYQCIDCKKCHTGTFLQNCQNCSSCSFCFDCRSCQDCLGCTGLRNKRHCIFNKQYSKEEYSLQKQQFMNQYRTLDLFGAHFRECSLRFPRKFADIEMSENATGDHLLSCKDLHHCFDLVETNDCSFTTLGLKAHGCVNCVGVPQAELCYQSVACPENYNLQFSAVIWPKSSHLRYCAFSRSSEDCFGCVGLHKNKYCFLNKQYTKQEYEDLMPKVIAHMQRSGEWGRFFPKELSPFPYNETLAQEQFPLTAEQAVSQDLQWRAAADDVPAVTRVIPAEQLPSIDAIPDDILSWAIRCTATKRPFRIQKRELEFYRFMHLPVPQLHPDERHNRRITLRNPRKLWERSCMKCAKDIQTTFAPERPEIVYCDNCYLSEVY